MFCITDEKPKRKEEIRKILDNKTCFETNIYILGRNDYAKNVMKGCKEKAISICAVVDDFTVETEFEGISVILSEQMAANSILISCVIEGKAVSAIQKIKSLKKDITILTYLDMNLYDHDLFPHVKFMEHNFEDIVEHKDKYEWLYRILEDQVSKDTLEHILKLRYNYSFESMNYFSFNIENQYFEPFVEIEPESIFVDGGSFDGQTSLKFSKLYPDYKEIYVFEPSTDSFEKVQENLRHLDQVHLFKKATYDKETQLKFTKTQGSANSFSEHGEVVVSTVCLDRTIPSADFIKLDVEGAEYETLLGAQRLIAENKPKLAVCVYHKQEDFWRIPEFVLSLNSSYRIFLRHYTEGIFETVAYFV